MLPVRAISEAIGMDVQWEELNRTVYIKSRSITVNGNVVNIIQKDVPIRCTYNRKVSCNQ